jgi:predicted amidohydrolase YtcJ
VPDHPVWLVRVDGHAALANAPALAAGGVQKGSTAPSGGEILVDDAGDPSGVLVDAAMGAVLRRIPAPTDAQLRERLQLAHDECLRHGLTCVHDAGVGRRELDAMLALHGQGTWKLRTYVMLRPDERELIARGPWQTGDALIVVRAVKAMSDGALGSRGAWLLDEYSDRPRYRGLQGLPKGAVLEVAQRCAGHGMQLCVHAIGDAANRAVLDAFAAVKVDGGIAPLRFRVEHAQVVAKDDFARFRDLGVLPSMQPTHLTSDMPWAPERLGPERVLRAYAWCTFHELGVVVPFGSDFPVESVDPRKGLFAAVTTRGEHGGPPDGYRPDQKLTREHALRGFTLHAAHGMFAEKDLGTIERGKIADFTVFDRDLRTCPDGELLQAKVLLTVVGGRVVHDGRRE